MINFDGQGVISYRFKVRVVFQSSKGRNVQKVLTRAIVQ